MSFILVAAYIFVSYVRVLELIPGLAELRLMLWMSTSALVISFWQWYNSPRRKKVSFEAPQIVMTLAFLFFGLCAALVKLGWNDFFTDISSMQITLGAFLMLIMNLSTMKRIRTIMFLLAVSALVMAGQGILAYHYGLGYKSFILDNTRTNDGDVRAPATDEDGNPTEFEPLRVKNVGFLDDPNDLAQSLATFLVMLGIFWNDRKRFRSVLLLGPVAVTILYGVYLTRSRGGLVSVGLMSLLFFREKLGKVMAGVLTGVLIMGALAINVTGGRAMKDESSDARIEAWASGILMLRSNPLFGIGYKQFADQHGLTAHNSYVLCFSEMGLVGYFCWMSLLVVSFIQLTRLKNLKGDDPELVEIRKIAGVLRLSFTTFLTAAFFLSRTYILTLFLLIALSLCLADIARRRGFQPQALPSKIWTRYTLAWQAISIAIVWLAVKVNGAG